MATTTARSDTFYGGQGYGNDALVGRFIIWGTGSPLNVVTADIGALFLRTDGGASTVLYVKESGNGASTGWVAK